MIPKKIFQTHLTKNIPPNSRKHIDRLRELNYDYEYIYHDDEDMERYIYDNFDINVFKALQRIKPGAGKADIWRLAVLYREGGVYIDFDRIMHDDTPPLRELLEDNDEFVHGRNWHVFGYNAPSPNSFLVARAKHPIIKNTLDSIVNSVNNKEPLLTIGHRNFFPDGKSVLVGELEPYTGTPHLWKALSDYIGIVDLHEKAPDWIREGKRSCGIRITNSVECYFMQNNEYGTDHVTMGGSHWSAQKVFNY